MSECFSQPGFDVAGVFNAYTLRAHRVGDFCEIRILEIHTEWDYAGLLHLDVDEIQLFIVENDLNHRGFSLDLGEQVVSKNL